MNKNKNVLLDESGFTLMELIVVIGIIVILIALLVPRFSGMTDKANVTSAQNDARISLTALSAYMTGIDTQLNGTFDDAAALREMNKALGDDAGDPIDGKLLSVTADEATLIEERSGLTYTIKFSARKGKILSVDCTGDASRCNSLLDSGLVTTAP